MNVLIINIDQHYRSVYTGTIAAALLKKIPRLKITGLISGPNDFLLTTGHFEKIHFFDTEDFFYRTKNLPEDKIEEKILQALGPVKNQKWDVTINLSSNLLGSIFTNFLNSKEIRGTSLNSDLMSFKHSDPAAFYLSSVPDDFGSFFHFTYLYRSMLKRFEKITLSSVWEGRLLDELDHHFESLKKKNNKTDIVLIDTKILKNNPSGDLEFFETMYKKFHDHTRLLPILIGSGMNENHPLIDKLKRTIKGEVYCLDFQNQAQLSIINSASLIITSDLYLKSVADIVLKPSIFLTASLNLSDYSTVANSFQLVMKKIFDLDVSFLVGLADQITTKTESGELPGEGVDVYETICEQNLPLLSPRSGGSPEYADWLLGVRFVAYMQKIQISGIKVNPGHYKKSLARQRDSFKKNTHRGVYSIGIGIAKANIKNFPTISENEVKKNFESFLSFEERTF